MRIVGWEVRPVIYADDGEHLTPVPIHPATVPASEWEAWKAGGDEESLKPVRASIEDDA